MSTPISFNAFLEPPVDVISVPLDQIVRDPDQPRQDFDPDSITSLAESMGRFGLLQPILIGPLRPDGTYMVLAGERRVRAARELAWETISAIIRDEVSVDRLYVQGAENLARNSLEASEVFALIERLTKAGESQSAIARGLGINRSTVVDYVAISRDSVARAAIVKGASFRTVIDELRARRTDASLSEPASQDLESPAATVTPIRPVSHEPQEPSRPDPRRLDSQAEHALPGGSPSAGTEPVDAAMVGHDRRDGASGPDDPHGLALEHSSHSDGLVTGPSHASASSPGPLAGGPPPTTKPAGEVARSSPLVEEMERYVEEIAVPSDDPAVLADRAARCLAAGLAVASDLPEPQFTEVVEVHYRKLQRIRDMGSARP